MQSLLGELSRAQGSARAVHGGHDGVERRLRAAAGQPLLEDVVGCFFGKWKYGCGLLAGDVDTLRSWLEVVRAELARVDADLAAVAAGGRP